MNCLFCAITRGELAASRVWEDDVCVAFMDLYPLREGHVLVVPREHAALLNQLPEATRDHLFRVACRVIAAQKAIGLHSDGANLIVNDGAPANQHVPHVHVHLVPRDGGDLGSMGWRFATRFVNPALRTAAHRRRLDEMASRLQAALHSTN